ncbi:hypothetical protein KL930_004194 [Ogataea haglerorum]|nr:hypothetical protein KL930_004194 [Ogataea haglerorum]KAG7775652.1 hypothetical protein KL922_004302 [Ogataea haglerorum]
MKRRGVRRACDACHLRKQRCDGLQPCFRCSKSDKICSYGEEHLPGASEIVNLMSTVLSSLGTIEQKIDLLSGISDMPATEPTPAVHRPPVAIQTISLRGAPMSTVQSAYSMAGNGMSENNSTTPSVRSPLPLLHQLYRTDHWCCDPVSLGILSLQDAQQLVDLYFEQMHSMAPLLTKSIHSNAAELRERSTLLFLTVCCVGARSLFQQGQNIHDLAALLDFSLSRVVLGRTDRITLEQLESLQIYAHWMPLRVNQSASRYNEVSVWNVIGLTIRWVKFMDLEGHLHTKFTGSLEDVRILRIMLNLVSLDYQTHLSTQLPTTIDPVPLVALARKFCSTASAETNDHKLLGLCELTLALKHATDLKYVNFFLDEWVAEWTNYPKAQLSMSEIPFTSMRWYRLSLNSAPLAGLCAGMPVPESEERAVLVALKRSVEAALDMFGLFLETPGWEEPKVNHAFLSRFRCAIDSYWMTHAFAFILLCILYARGAVDETFFCRIPTQNQTTPPAPNSPLSNLLHLGLRIFDLDSTHPAAHIAALVHQVYDSLELLDDSKNYVEDVFPIPLDEGFDLNLFLARQCGDYT